MNGLEYIRIRCNMSQTFLAQKFGVTRQTVNMWEHNKLPMSVKRKEQLAEFFGMEISLLEEISDEQCKVLDEMPQYKHQDGDRQYYCYTIHDENVCKPLAQYHLIPPNGMPLITYDTQYALLRQELKELTDSIEKLPYASPHVSSVHDKSMAIRRVLHIFAPLAENVERLSTSTEIASCHRMLYYHMLFDLMTALSLAMGSMNKEDFQKGDNWKSGPFDMQYSWILHMAKEIGNHLNELKNQVPVISRTIK